MGVCVGVNACTLAYLIRVWCGGAHSPSGTVDITWFHGTSIFFDLVIEYSSLLGEGIKKKGSKLAPTKIYGY